MGESIIQETLELESGGGGHSNDILSRIPDSIRATFDAEQIAAIRAATKEDWSSHPVNIRLRNPLLLQQGYLTLVAGICHRSPAAATLSGRLTRCAPWEIFYSWVAARP